MARLPGADPLLVLATILLVGMLFGWLAQRIRLPSVTGQILAGVLLGPSVLALFPESDVASLEPLTHFALALIGVTVGAHLNVRRLRNAGRRLFWLLVTEATITPLLAGGAMLWLYDGPPTLAFLLGTLAVSTAPATVVALVAETRSRGVFVKTLVAAVALNNMACIFLFELARGVGHLSLAEGALGAVPAMDVLLRAAWVLLQSVGVGAGVALATHAATLRVLHPSRLATVSAVALLLAFGSASYLGVSPLAACLALGVTQTNLSPSRDRIVDSVFADFEPVILCAFFTLAGMHLSLGHAAEVGVLAGAFVVARASGKVVAADLAMRLAGATERVRRHLGLALVPQAGVAVGLVILVQDDAAFEPIREIFTAVVLTAVTVNEIVGPIATRYALGRSGETGQDHPRLVDFLQEESIDTELEADSMEEAIGKMVDLLIRSHQLAGVDRTALRRSVLEREAKVSTCLGAGLAVPHGDLPEGCPMVGVMGISRRGLPFKTPDDRPVHCVVLLATPLGERDRHLEVLATLARTVGSDPAVQDQLYRAKSPAHVCEILHGEDTEKFNYFLGERGSG